MVNYEFHDAANELPMLSGGRLEELVEDIKANGLKQPIVLYDGKVLDGRNRYTACLAAGVEPTFIDFVGGDPYAYVWSLNGQRRDLTQDQRYLIWKSLHEKSEAWQSKQRQIRAEANRKRAEATSVQPRNEDGTMADKPVQPQVVAKPAYHETKSSTAKAEASKTNRGSVERMDMLARERPDLAEKVKTGEIPAAAAIREMKTALIVERLQNIETMEAKAAQGVYDVIVIDPPWPMEKIERDVTPNQVKFDYPVMSEAELVNLSIPAADDCHMWLWTTHKFLPMAFRLLDAWEFKYVCTFVWHKPGGFQPFGLPQYNCEMALYCRRGSPHFVDTKAFPVCFDAPRGAHSEKPEQFYDVIRRVTAGRRLDMFNRRLIDGFDGWGKEAAA